MSWEPYSGKRQIYAPPGKVVVNLAAGGESAFNFDLRIRVPDSRLRVKVTVFFSPAGPFDPDTINITGSTTLWLYAADVARLGGLNGLVPETDLEGDRTTPLPIPETSGLIAYSREFVTSGDYIGGRLFATENGVAGIWGLQVQWQPEGQRLPDDEWDEIRSQCGFEVQEA